MKSPSSIRDAPKLFLIEKVLMFTKNAREDRIPKLDRDLLFKKYEVTA